MRDIKQLLEILLDQYQRHEDDAVRCTGLCDAIEVLCVKHGIFTESEKERLYVFIYNCRPDRNTGTDDYWWDRGMVDPRAKFLEQLIDRL